MSLTTDYLSQPHWTLTRSHSNDGYGHATVDIIQIQAKCERLVVKFREVATLQESIDEINRYHTKSLPQTPADLSSFRAKIRQLKAAEITINRINRRLFNRAVRQQLLPGTLLRIPPLHSLIGEYIAPRLAQRVAIPQPLPLEEPQ